jgi:hypothetical protein
MIHFSLNPRSSFLCFYLCQSHFVLLALYLESCVRVSVYPYVPMSQWRFSLSVSVAVSVYRYMAPHGFPERDIALHAAVLSFPHPVSTKQPTPSTDSNSDSDSGSGCVSGAGRVVCVAPLPVHWEARYGAEVAADIAQLCAELQEKYSNDPK